MSWKHLGGFYYDIIYSVTYEADEDSCNLLTEFYVVKPSLFLLGLNRQVWRKLITSKVMVGQPQHQRFWVGI